MSLNRPQQLLVFAALVLMMAMTRFHHFLSVPDASWAIYFVGGFYLKGLSRWAFPVLMLEAVAIDYIATQHLGVSSYCLTPAYAFLVPTHAVLWLAGSALHGRLPLTSASLARLAGTAFVAITLAYAISNGSFYWLSGRVDAPTVAGALKNASDWYLPYLGVSSMYIAIAAALHVLWAGTRSRQPGLVSPR